MTINYALLFVCLPACLFDFESLKKGNDLGMQGAKVLGESLKNNSTLTKLHLNSIYIYLYMLYSCETKIVLQTDCNIGIEGTTILCDVLKNNSTLTQLDLSRDDKTKREVHSFYMKLLYRKQHWKGRSN